MMRSIALIAICLAGCASDSSREKARNPIHDSLIEFSGQIRSVQNKRPDVRGCLSSIELLTRSGVLAKLPRRTNPNKVVFLSAGTEYLNVHFVYLTYGDRQLSISTGDSTGIETNFEHPITQNELKALGDFETGVAEAKGLRRQRFEHDQCVYVEISTNSGDRNAMSTNNMLVDGTASSTSAKTIRSVDALLDNLMGE